MELVALFFPAAISVCIWHRRNARASWSVLPVLMEYGIWVVCNVLISVLAIVYVFHRPDILAASFEEFSFVWKYLLIAILAACLLPYVTEVILKCVGVTFSAEAEERGDK